MRHTQGKLEFNLHEKRLKGQRALVRMRDQEKDKGGHNWLLIQELHSLKFNERSSELANEFF